MEPTRAMLPHVIIHESAQLIDWASDRLGIQFFADARAIGWGAYPEIRAAAIYERWSGNDCVVHLVSDEKPGWLTRNFIAAGFYFPFVMGGLQRVTGLVPAANARARRLNLHFGYREEGCLRRGAENGDDIIIMGMLREECRFISEEHRHG